MWETQQLDYPLLEDSLPPYEPRGCQRGISYSWYLYSPLRIKYPLIRGTLLDFYREERKCRGDPLKAWENLQNNKEKRKRYQWSRGKADSAGHRGMKCLKLWLPQIFIRQKHGPDRVAGFSPIPAMSMLSYAARCAFPSTIRWV